MHHIAFVRGRNRALAPAAALLLALCLLAVGVQALTDPMDTAALVTGAGEVERSVDLPVLADANASSTLVISAPGRYELDHDLISSDAIGVLITSSDVVFDGMGHTIEGTNANATGVRVAPPTSLGTITNVTVRNLTVRDCGAGFATNGVAGCVVEDVVAERNTVGFAVNANGGTGTDHFIRDSVFRENSRVGIDLGFQGHGASIERCSITGNGEGVTLDYFHSSDRIRNRIVDSTVSENAGNAISIADISNLLVDNCTVHGNGDNGVYVEHSSAEIVGCHIENNAGSGVRSSDRGSSDIHGNWIEGNGEGVGVGGDWGSSVRNNYFNNTDNGYFGPVERGLLDYEKTAGRNIVGGPFLGGNFWASPNGTGFSQTHQDADHDGICDEPYVVNPEEGVTDSLPLAPWNGTPVIAPTPYKQHPVPGRVEAEDYDIGGEGISYHDTTPGNAGGAYRHDDVDIETANGITDVGWIRDGEWLIYTLNVPEGGYYRVTARAASPDYDRSATVSVNAQAMSGFTIRFPKTGSFATYATTTEDYLYLPAGNDTVRLTFQGDGQNLDWIEFTPQTSTTPTPTPVPYKPLSIPGTIQAEDYNLGGEGVAYHDTTPGNAGGAYRHDDVDIETENGVTDVGWIRDGEWLAYTADVQARDTYTLTARVASPNSGRTIDLAVDGNLVRILDVPNTGSFSTYGTVETTLSLDKGQHTLTLTFWGDGQNIDRIVLAAPSQAPALTISSPGRYTLDHDLSSDVTGVLITSSDVVLDGMGHSITCTGAFGTAFETGVNVQGFEWTPLHNVTVRNLTVRSWDRGLAVTYTADALVENVLVDQCSQEGLYILYSDRGIIRSSTFRNGGVHGSGTGVDVGVGIAAVGERGGLEITGCSVTGNDFGIDVFKSDEAGEPALLEGNDVSDNRDVGIAIDWSIGSIIRNSTVRGNGADGILVDHGRALIDGNRIEGNAGAGINASENASATITGNRIAGNAPGIVGDISGEAAPLEVWNNVLNNSANLELPAGVAVPQLNVTKTAGPNIVGGPFIGGNAWANPSGTGFSQTHPDTDGDGFCDEPYHVGGAATDSLPLALRNGTPTPQPYRPLSIPGTIQAEDYNLGGEGVAYHDTTPGNEGGAYRHDDVDIETAGGITNVGWIRSGEYLTYTANVTAAGQYTMNARVASPNSGRTIAVSVDGASAATISVPNTGSFEAFRTVEVPVTLAAGQHTLTLAFSGDGQNLDWIAFGVPTSPTPTPTPSVATPTPTPTPEAGGASFTAAPLTAAHGSAVKFTVTPASGKSISAAWWSFDAPAHLNTWNSRATNPTFFYPAAGTFSPLVKITYTDGSTETVQRANYVRAT
ncbi:MAG: carbohydrate-binding protein [Methanospirillum sp.]